MKNKLSMLQTILQKEKVSYVVKQNITSSIHLLDVSVSYTYLLNHKRNEIGYSYLRKQKEKKTVIEINDNNKKEKKLKIVFVEDSIEIEKSEIVKKQFENLGPEDAVIIVDSTSDRRGEFENDRVLVYTPLIEFVSSFSKYNALIFFLLRDVFPVIKIIGRNEMYDEDEISINKNHKFFFVKKLSPKFLHNMKLDKVRDWDTFQSSLANVYTKKNDIIEEPLMDSSVLVRFADEILLYIRLLSIKIYSKILGKETLEAKKRITHLERTIKNLKIRARSERTDKELDEMNDILNNFKKGGN